MSKSSGCSPLGSAVQRHTQPDSGSALFEITEQNADSATFNRYARNRELQNLQNWLLLVL